MASAPPQAPETIVLGSFSGVKNVVSEERLKQGELAVAVNVDIDDAGQLRRRRGYAQLDGRAHHSLAEVGDQLLVVREGMLGALDDALGFTPLVEVGPDPLAYENVGDTVYFSSRTASGKLVGGGPQPWGSQVSPGRWVSPVVNPTDTLGLVGGRLLGTPPNATVLELYKGRIYLGHERTIWATELYLYDLVDKTRNFIQLEDDVTMIAAVDDGLYVGTMAQLLFLSGTFSAGLKITEVMGESVVPGSLTWVPFSKADPRARTGPVTEGTGPMFLTSVGVVFGMDGGNAYNLTQDHFVFPSAVRAAAVYREDQGVNSYLVVPDSAGGPASNARIGDYCDAEIVRAATLPVPYFSDDDVVDGYVGASG